MNKKGIFRKVFALLIVFTINAQSLPMPPQTVVPPESNAMSSRVALPGQSLTILPNGAFLLLGGIGKNGSATSTATYGNPRTGAVISLPHSLNVARAWHTASVLPDGTVFIFGGVGSDGAVVPVAEIFDPAQMLFRTISTSLTPRAHHTAPLLTDGELLLAGGMNKDGLGLQAVETWDSRALRAAALDSQLPEVRLDDHSALLADGTTLLWGGKNSSGNKLDYAELYDPKIGRFLVTTTTQALRPDLNVPFVEDSIPEDGAENVPLNALISVRFSKLLLPSTVSPRTVTLQSEAGMVQCRVIAAESGRLAFVTPASPLSPGTKYLVTIQGASDAQGLPVSYKQVAFTTVGNPVVTADAANSTDSSSPSNNPPPAPAKAVPGVTAVSGLTLKLDGSPLPNVTLRMADKSARSDRTGHFLLANVPNGFQTLLIDGRTASVKRHSYGVFETGVQVLQGVTLKLPYAIWMTELDMVHAVPVHFPTVGEVIITTPTLPGLEFHIPPNTTITDIDGKVASSISITPIPIRRPPFPLPHVEVPIYFTIQPGGGKIWVNNTGGPQGARLFYPNLRHQAPGTVVDFWNYDPHSSRGWYIYGKGTVSSDGKTIVPNRGVEIYALTGAMVGGSGWGAGSGGGAGGNPGGGGGDPIDLSTGLFVYIKTDLYLPDVLPISATRAYRQNDTMVRAFGVGMSIPYDMWIEGNLNDLSYVELVQADGSRLRYDRTAGNFWNNSTLVCDACPGPFFGSVFYDPTPGFSGSGSFWEILLKDGTLLTFIQPGNEGTSDYQGIGLVSITDRNGNQVKVIRNTSNGTNYITQVVSPNGRWIQFYYGNGNCPSCITSAQDNLGRTVQYFYDSQNRLVQVTDANNGIWSYGWDPTHVDQMTTLTDARGILFLQNFYDANDRVDQQIQGDGTVYKFTYTLDAYNNVSRTAVTDPNGNVRQVTFGTPQSFPDGIYVPGGYTSTDTLAVGTPEQQVLTYARDPNTGLIANVTDSLNRQTSFTYDNYGNLTSVTHLTGTASAVTTSFTYDPQFSQLASITDPLQHKTVFGYDTKGNVVTASDPLGNTFTYTHDGLGRLIGGSDPLGNTWTYSYSGPDLSTITDPLGNRVGLTTDGAGRIVALTDPSGQRTTYTYNPLNRLTQITDPLGGITGFQYSPNGRPLSVTDARNTQNPTQYSYDSMDRLQKRTDPLGAIETFSYDGNGNLSCYTDRRGSVTSYAYDRINRPIFVGYGATSCTSNTYQSTTSYTYDPVNRLIGITDSAAGGMAPIFDGLDRLVSVATPQGSISYQYDAAGRKTNMTVSGQPSTKYTYDNADRLTQITQGSSNVVLGYDIASRRTGLTLPNGVFVSYGYDNDSRLTSISYQSLAVPLGNLTYTFDQNSRVTQVGGSFARAALPAAVSSASYDVANRLTAWGGNSSFSYDANGNLQGDGTNIYNWDARNQLSSITGGATAAFQYDALRRRIAKTVNGVTTGFLYDGANAVQELSGGAPSANLLTGGIDEIFSRSDTTSRSFLSDGLGSTVALTDSTGSIATQYTYEPFGNASTSGTASSNSFQYTGRENDGTGLFFYRDRYYAPLAQRFVSQDPIGFRGGSTNLYSYALGSPTNFTDPSGDQAEEAAWICVVQPELCLAVAGGALITYPIWGPMLSKGINNLGNSIALSTPISTPADPNGRKGEPPNPKKRCFDNSDIAQAQQEYPDKAGEQVHHRIPRFMGGTDDPSNLFPLPSAYHQLITNAWRDKFGYKNDPWFNRPSDLQEIEDFAKQLEEKYPLERCN